MSKNIVKTEVPQLKSQYGAYVLRVGLSRLCARIRIHTPTRSGTHMHGRTHKHVHTDQYVILITFPLQQWFGDRDSVLQYTYIACIVAKHLRRFKGSLCNKKRQMLVQFSSNVFRRKDVSRLRQRRI